LISLLQNALCHSFMPLEWGYELEVAVFVLVVIPTHELHRPGSGLIQTGEWLVRIVGLIFTCAEQ